jgi:hypothetical protein
MPFLFQCRRVSKLPRPRHFPTLCSSWFCIDGKDWEGPRELVNAKQYMGKMGPGK